MAASLILHAGLILLLGTLVGGQAALSRMQDELTEIAYIEARYGEDVAAKVKIKERPSLRPEMPGRGVNTDSALKSEPKAAPGEPAPAPLPKAKLRSQLQAPALSQPARPKAAETQVVAPELQARTQQQMLAEASQLEAKAPRPKSRQVLEASRLGRSLADSEAADVAAPRAASRQASKAFQPTGTGLQSKSGSVALGDQVIPGDRASQSTAKVDEAAAAISAGGSLQGNSRGAYQAPRAALAPSGSGGGRGSGGGGVVDVDGPGGGGGGSGSGSGRKTILDYGSGGGGRGGGLAGRGRIAEPAPTKSIVAQSTNKAEPKQEVAEANLGGKGINMTISGEIKGRKILKSVVAEYPAQARKKGWEGVVAVHFTVLADGRVKDNTYFEQTSVHRPLNQAALEAIKQFKFAPLPAGQAAVEQWGIITIVFRLN
jgi:TonB family protein